MTFGQGVELLVVDDLIDVRDIVRLNAERDDRVATVHEAPDGASAIDVARARPDIGIVVLDYHMPNGNGVEVLPSLRELLPDATIVLYTSDPTVAAEARAAGADAVFDKSEPVATVLDSALDLR